MCPHRCRGITRRGPVLSYQATVDDRAGWKSIPSFASLDLFDDLDLDDVMYSSALVRDILEPVLPRCYDKVFDLAA